MIKILHKIIKPVLKHIISANCFHLAGPSGVKPAIDYVSKSLTNNDYNYFLKLDIKGYYASIDRKILVAQIKENFNDLKIIKYLEEIATTAIINNGEITVPDKGVPRRSSLSPVFGAFEP